MLLDIRYWVRRPAQIRYLVFAALLCIGLSCYFWLPMLEQMTQLSFRLNLDVGNEQHRFTDNMYNPLRLLATPLLAKIIKPDDPVTMPRLTCAFGYGAMAIALFWAWRHGPRRSVKLFAATLLFVWLGGTLFHHPAAGGDAAGGAAVPLRILLDASLAMGLFVGAAWPSIKPGFWRGADGGAGGALRRDVDLAQLSRRPDRGHGGTRRGMRLRV